MSSVILAILLTLLAIFGPRIFPARYQVPLGAVWLGRGILGLLIVYLIMSTSIIMIPKDQVGIATKIYGSAALPEGHIIATRGETGIQAEPIPPGTFRVSLFFNILNHIDVVPIVMVPNGFYGRVVARDGDNLPEGQIMADAWPDAQFSQFLDAQYFMTHRGQKGLQLSVLKPGTYPINTALFQVKVGYKKQKDVQSDHDDVWDERGYHVEQTPLDTSITVVPAGFVGVVRSSVQDKSKNCTAITAKADTTAVQSSDSLTAEVVPQGCRGVWQYALPPNDYYLNRDAYDVALSDTRVQTLEFKGGYKRRYIDLKVDSKGEFTQSERGVDIQQPADAADSAVYTKAEGWEIPQELRVVLQISPERAPLIVAAVGGLKDVEQRIMIPSIRSHVRNVFGGSVAVREMVNGTLQDVTRPTRVMDTIEQRPALEEEILRRVQVDGKRAGVDVKEIRLGESAVPPELLLARQREQLAEQLKRAFIQEQAAQEQRQKTEQARATAEQQNTLVTAQINLQKSLLFVSQRDNDGAAEQKYLERVAAGQKSQTEVLGQDRVALLKALEMVLEKPQILQTLANIRLPGTMVIGSNGGLNFDSVAAILKGSVDANKEPARQ